MLRFSVVTLMAVATALVLGTSVGNADERWIIEPGPEAKDAQKLGAADVERAQKLAKDKHLAEARAVLESVDQKWPAAVHDCNLALAYLREKSYTRAQLVWDLGALRNGVRPKWCTGEVSTQLSDALRSAGYVPTTIEVAPPDALVEVSGIPMRSMRTVWLPPGPATFNASAPGKLPKAVQATISAPVSRVAITLEEPKVETPDAGVVVVAPPAVTPDAYVTPTAPIAPIASGSVDAGAEEQAPSLIDINGKPVGRRTIALVTALGCGVAAGVLGYLTYYEKNKANDHYKTDPAFTDAYDNYKGLSLATSIVAGATVVSTVIYVYLLTTDNKPIPKPGTVQVTSGPGVIGIGISGTFGGGDAP